MRSKISRILMTMSLVLCMAISVFAIKTNAADTKANSDDSLVSVGYTVAEAKEFLDGDNLYPKKDGYLFAGWYTVEASELPASDEEAKQYAIQGSVPSGVDKLYALFVPEHVLSIKAQVSATMVDDNINNDNKSSIRFVTTVNSLLYKQVGFEVTYTKNDETPKTVTSESNRVYESLYVVGTDKPWEVTPQELFCGVSKYFKACTIKNVPETYYSTGFTVKPYWITLDGDKVYGIEATKTIADGCIRDEVWVSSQTDLVPMDLFNYGSYKYPYATLDYALAHVNNGGIVHVKDSLTIASGTTWTAHNKNVTITGNSEDEDNETLEFAGTSISINDGVTFTALELKVPTSQTFMYAEGNKLVIKDDVTFTNSSYVQLFGGSSKTDPIASTHLEVYTGTYDLIAGGTRTPNSVVSGDTNVIIGGATNVTGNVYGAGFRGIVEGDTHVEVKGDATLTSNLYGGGHEATNSVVEGSTNVKFAGKSVKNIFGGSYAGTNGDTHVVMAGGRVEQIFGGSHQASMTGNTDVQLLGGTVSVRVYGGCFNDYNSSTSTWAETSYTVTGYTSVTFGPKVDGQYAVLDIEDDVDSTYYAVSRYTQNAEGETGVFIVNDYNVAANPNTEKVGYTNLMNTGSYNVQPYHYLVNATSGGEVYSAGDKIYIKPDQEMNATVTIDGETVYSTKEENYYQLPELSSPSTEIVVNFKVSELFYRNDKKTSSADPFVLDNTNVDGNYYMYVTSDAKNIYCYRSTDLMAWTKVGNMLDTSYPDSDTFSQVCSAEVWAPEVIYDNGVYYMFFSATPAEDTNVAAGKGVEHGTAQRQLMVATSNRPDADFQLVNFKDADSCGETNLHTYNEEAGIYDINFSESSLYKDAYPHYYAKYLFLSPEKYSAFLKADGNGGASSGQGGYTGAIDPHPFVDSNGDKYLYWKIEQSPTRICAVQMENWLQPKWDTAKVLTCYKYYTIDDWHNASNDTVAYESADNNEGPEVIKHNGKYYLTYSVNRYTESTYQVGVAVADSPLGTFRKLTEAEGGLLLSTAKTGSQEISGAGHHSFVTVGDQLYIVYHRHNDVTNPSGARNHAIDEVKWITIKDKDGNDLDVMYVNGPTCTAQPKIEDYSNYVNIADEAGITVDKDTGVENISCLTDGLLSTDKYGNETFMQYIKETSITETTTFTFDFDDPRIVRGIMVYNSKMRDSSFENISKIELVCEENDGEVVHTIENVEFNPDYYTDDYVISGAAAIAEIEEIYNVKKIRITVDVPENQDAVGISEIRILGKALGEDNVIFKNNNAFNLENQGDGIISVPATSSGDTGWVETLGDYNVLETTVKDYAQGKNHEYAIVSSFYFSNGKHASFRFYYNADMDRYQLQSANGIFGWNVYKYFSEDDSEGLYAKATEEGIPFKMVREGTKLKLYFNETLLRVLDLTKDSSGNATGITATTTCIARFSVNNSTGYEVTLPFELADKSENVVFEINDSENGSIVTGKAEYLPGEKVTLIAKAALGYDCSKIEINGEEVALKDDGTYSFEATEDIYEIIGCFEQTENYENISFNAYMSILGDSISTYAGVSNNAQMNDTIGNNNVYYSASQLQQNQTYWGRLLEKYGLQLCVNNSTGGGRLSEDVGTDGVRPSAVTRSVELHNNAGKTPDIITVYIGINDLFGSVDLTRFENAYTEMLNNMLETYGEAEILCCTLLPANNKGFADKLDEYNDIIRECVAQYDDRVTLVDIYEESGITWDNFIRYTMDAVHPTAEGMKLISYVLEEAVTNKEFYEAKIGDTYYGTLEEAVAAAKADETSETVEITVLKNVKLTSRLTINRNMVLKNASGKNVVISGTADVVQLIITTDNSTFEISGTEDGSITVDGESINRDGILVQNSKGCIFTLGTNAAIKNGRRDNGWGAGFYNQGTAYLYGDITGNTAGWGAAIRNDESVTVTIYAGTYSNNTATVNGGAIYNNGGIINIEDGNFTGNTSTSDGGAIFNKGTIDIKGGTFTGNSCSTSTGGVIRNESSGTVKISAGTFSGNTAKKGGVIYNFGTLEITGGTFKSNTATSSGGVLHAQKDTTNPDAYGVTVENAYFYKNSSADGGALLCLEATITNCIFGGYDENGDSLGNTASNRGGAICQWSPGGTITVDNCTFIKNTGEQGNALYSSAGTITVSNSRINASDAVKTAEDYIIINALPEAKIGDVPYDTLKEAVAAAKADTSGEPVEITVLNHVQLESTLTIEGNIIFNTSDSNPVVISGDSSSTGNVVLIRINSGKTLNIAGAITVDGNDIARPALIQNDGGTFILGAYADVVNAMRDGYGAAFFNNNDTNAGTVGIAHLYGDFRGNTAKYGAAVRNAGTVYIYGGTYQSNTATQQGGALYNAANGTIEITGGTFQNNTAVNAGGAIWCAENSKSVSIKNAYFYSNSAKSSDAGVGNGGAIVCYAATIENCVFDGNEASNRGGVVCQWRGTISITGCSFSNNTAKLGKILNNSAGTITVQDCTGITSDDVEGTGVTIQ